MTQDKLNKGMKSVLEALAIRPRSIEELSMAFELKRRSIQYTLQSLECSNQIIKLPSLEDERSGFYVLKNMGVDYYSGIPNFSFLCLQDYWPERIGIPNLRSKFIN